MTVPPFRFIASMPQFTVDAAEWRTNVRRIEDLGFHTVAVSDHFTQGWVMDPLVAMTAGAEATSTLRFMTLVLGNDYRHPVLLHKALATLDVLSGGRVDIGLGAGWMPTDYAAAGIALDRPGVRIQRLAESIEVLKRLFADKPADYVGRHYQITELDGLPKPVQRPHPPILVGGRNQRMLELAGRVADIVGIDVAIRPDAEPATALLDLTEDRITRQIGWARAAAESAGRAPQSLAYQMSILYLDVTDGPQAQPWVSGTARHITDPAALSAFPVALQGTAGQCAEQLHRLREEFGLSHIHFGGNLTSAAAVMALV